MKKDFLTIGAASLLLAALCGCNTMYGGMSSRGQAARDREQAALREQMAREQVRQDAQSARAAAQSAESRLDQIDLRVERLETASRGASWATQADVAALRREIEALRAELADARARAGTEHERIRSDIVSNVQGLIKEQQRRAPAPPPPPRQQSGYEHRVESGQTLSAIAQAYGVPVRKIKEANKLNSDVIRVGQVLFIPD